MSRQCKEEEARRQQELEAAAAAAASAAEQAEAAAAAAAARAMAVVPTTAKGAPAKQLLDVLPEQRLGLLLAQVGMVGQWVEQPSSNLGGWLQTGMLQLSTKGKLTGMRTVEQQPESSPPLVVPHFPSAADRPAGAD